MTGPAGYLGSGVGGGGGGEEKGEGGRRERAIGTHTHTL